MRKSIHSGGRHHCTIHNAVGAGKFLCSLLAVLLCAGCSSAGSVSDQPQYLKIGMVLYNINDTFLSELTEDFRSEVQQLQTQNDDGKDLNVSITVKDGGLLQRVEDERLEELVDAGSDILCVNLVDRTAPSHVIDLAKAKDIPVIFFNREPVQEDLSQWDKLYYVGSDARESGVLQGQMAAEYVRQNPSVDRNKDGKIQFIILEGEPDHQDAIIRTESCVSTMADEGLELEKLSYQVANWNRAQARTKMSQMITKYGSGIELVLANNDEMAIGCVEAYNQANITESDRPAVFGIDGTREGLEALSAGDIQGTVYHDRKGEAWVMAQLCQALYREKQQTAAGRADQEEEIDLQKIADEANDAHKEGDILGNVQLDGRSIYMSYTTVTKENLENFAE